MSKKKKVDKDFFGDNCPQHIKDKHDEKFRIDRIRKDNIPNDPRLPKKAKPIIKEVSFEIVSTQEIFERAIELSNSRPLSEMSEAELDEIMEINYTKLLKSNEEPSEVIEACLEEMD